MATENTINGNYAAQKPYEHSDQYNAAASGAGASEIPSRDATSAARAGNNPGESEDKPPTKEEIGWYFVEQYYKTLCNEPAKLYVSVLLHASFAIYLHKFLTEFQALLQQAFPIGIWGRGRKGSSRSWSKGMSLTFS